MKYALSLSMPHEAAYLASDASVTIARPHGLTKSAGDKPSPPPVEAPDGNLYGTTSRNRARLWLCSRFLLVVALTCLSMNTAHANGVNTSIGNGDIQYGTVTGTGGIDAYTFTVPSTASRILVTIGQTGTIVGAFRAQLLIYNPSGTLVDYANLGSGNARAYSSIGIGTSGTFTAKVKRLDSGTTGGSYAVHLAFVVSGSDGIPVTPPNQGSAMHPSVSYGGSIGDTADRANLGIWTFSGVAGNSATFSMTMGSGAHNMRFEFYNPSGALIAYANFLGTTGSKNIGTMVAGTYTVLAYRQDAYNNAMSYTLSSADIGLPGVIPPPLPPSSTAKLLGCGGAGTAHKGNPCDVASGNKFEQVIDYATSGSDTLSFVRSYNSLAAASYSSHAGALGVNWRSNYDRYVRMVSATSLFVERPSGQALSFTLKGGVWTPDSDVNLKLTQSGSGAGSRWTLTDQDDTVENYTMVDANNAVLSSVQARNGYTQTLNYSGTQLQSVTDSFGRSLQFTYQNGLLQSVTTPDSLVLTYSYAAAGGSNRLVSVAYNTSPQTSQSYVYENAAFPFALTGIIDENGNRFATWTYDTAGRATSSQHAGGADLTQFAYNADGSRTVTDPLGAANRLQIHDPPGRPEGHGRGPAGEPHDRRGHQDLHL